MQKGVRQDSSDLPTNLARMTRTWRILVALLAFVLAAPMRADAVVDTLVVTYVGGAESNDFDYLPGSDNLPLPAVLVAGGTLQYRNLNTGLAHDLMSTLCVAPDGERWEDLSIGGSCERPDPLADGTRLFSTPAPLGFNQQAPVLGTAELPPGDHAFYCSLHGPPMAGTLKVVGA